MSKKLKITAPITNSDESVTFNVDDIATKNYVQNNYIANSGQEQEIDGGLYVHGKLRSQFGDGTAVEITADGDNGPIISIQSDLNDNSNIYYIGVEDAFAGSVGLSLPATSGTLATTDYVVANPASVTATLTGITINGTSYGINGGYTIDTTTGSESISDGTHTLNVLTRDTAQTITGTKTFLSDIITDVVKNTSDDLVLESGLNGYGIILKTDSAPISFQDRGNGTSVTFSFSHLTLGRSLIIPDDDGTLALTKNIPTYYRHTIRLMFDSDIDQITYQFYFTYVSSSGTTLAQNDLAGLVAQLGKFSKSVSYYQVGASSLNYGAIITDLTTTSISFVDLTSGSPANMKTVDIHSNIQVNNTAIAL